MGVQLDSLYMTVTFAGHSFTLTVDDLKATKWSDLKTRAANGFDVDSGAHTFSANLLQVVLECYSLSKEFNILSSDGLGGVLQNVTGKNSLPTDPSNLTPPQKATLASIVVTLSGLKAHIATSQPSVTVNASVAIAKTFWSTLLADGTGEDLPDFVQQLLPSETVGLGLTYQGEAAAKGGGNK